MEHGFLPENASRERRPQRNILARHGCSLLFIAVLALLNSCRKEEVWSGAEYNVTGSILRLASDEPFCGCLEAENVSTQPIVLECKVHLDEDRMGLVERGRITLRPGQGIQERFDWVGPAADDVYLLNAMAPNGNPLKIREVIRMNGYGWPFKPCDTHECKLGPLHMNTGALHER
jgi:hypothetical protein